MSTQAEVIVREGHRTLGRYFLDPGEYTVGRDIDCDILVDADGTSRHHARITLNPEGLLVRDLDSTNGTYLGDRRVEGSAPVPLGDPIRFGATGTAVIRWI